MIFILLSHGFNKITNYSCTVKVSCLLLEFSNRFGVLMSKIAISDMPKTSKHMKQTNSPDKMGALINPTQSIAGPNLLSPFSFGCSWKKRRG